MSTVDVQASSPRNLKKPAGEPRGRDLGRRLINIASRASLIWVFLAIVVVFSILRPDTYATADNWQSIASTQAVIALLALAATLPLIVGEFDVSIGFQLSFAQAICSSLILWQGTSPALAVLIVVACSALIGLINGFLVVKVGLDSFIATLGVGTILVGITEMATNAETITGELPASFVNFGREEVLGVPLPFVYVMVVTIGLYLAMEYTRWGRECHARGANARAALLAGVRTDRVTIQCFVMAGVLASLAGVLSVTILGGSSPTVGLGELLPAYAAAFLGATAIKTGRFNAIGTTLAVFLLAAGIIGLQQVGADFYVVNLFNGGALLVAITLSALAAKRSRSE